MELNETEKLKDLEVEWETMDKMKPREPYRPDQEDKDYKEELDDDLEKKMKEAFPKG